MPSFEFVSETGSTNADLVKRIKYGEIVPEGRWLIADRQSEGRGRQGRTWLDAKGNFMGSTVVSLTGDIAPATTLSFASALAVYETVLPRLSDPRLIQLKWPNDLLLTGEKFCGILLERAGDYAVIGIGVNLAATPVLADRKASAIAAAGPAPQRDDFARDLAANLEIEIERWRTFGTLPLLNRWQAAAHPPGTVLRVHDGNSNVRLGCYEGLENDGALRLRLEDGSIHVIRAGDVEIEEGNR